MAKIKITENKLKNIIIESIKKALNEGGMFNDNITFSELGNLLKIFVHGYFDVDEKNNITNWDEIVDDIKKLVKQSEEKMFYDKIGAKEIFDKTRGDWDSFDREIIKMGYDPDQFEWDYLENYANNYEIWSKQMPAPEELKTMIGELIKWLDNYYGHKKENVLNEIESEQKWLTSELSKI